jgi:hypothetical protein
MNKGRRTAAAVATAMALSGLVGAVAGCAGGSSGAGGSTSSGGAGHAAAAPLAQKSDQLGPLTPAGSAGVRVPVADRLQLPPPRSAVIRTAALALRVSHGRFAPVMDAAAAIATRFGGFVSRRSQTGQSVHDGRLVLRVPAARFQPALQAIERLGRPTSETEAGVDVTQQFVNLAARLHNLTSQERALRRLMTRAVTVADTIRVQGVLQNVELQMEEIQGQLIYLRNRTALSTISIAVHEAGKRPAPPQHASALWRAGRRAISAMTAVVAAVIVGAGVVIPIAVLVVLALLAGRLAAPWAAPLAARRRGSAGPPPNG